MTTLQIVLLAIAGASALASIVFMIMFIVEVSRASKEESGEVQNIYSTENYVTITNQEDASVEDMLASLEEQTKEEVVEEVAEESVEEIAEEVVENEEVVEEVVEEPVQEEVVEEAAEEIVEETVEETVEEVVEEAAEEPTEEIVEEVVEEKVEEVVENKEPIIASSVLDYKARLEKMIENRDKIDRDLAKIQKAILKYERTKRRKNRNQKMLDRRASELTNLNLVMYSVTDIKNVDEDKKVKQEELTAHIAELKASIQDAEEFIDSNKEKNDHNVKMAKFLTGEMARYNEEIAEIEALIAKAEDTAISA